MMLKTFLTSSRTFCDITGYGNRTMIYLIGKANLSAGETFLSYRILQNQSQDLTSKYLNFIVMPLAILKKFTIQSLLLI
jgi:hypothetical protein